MTHHMSERFEPFCTELKGLRLQAALTQEQFAKLLGVTRSVVSRVENGGEIPNEQKDRWRIALIRARACGMEAPTVDQVKEVIADLAKTQPLKVMGNARDPSNLQGLCRQLMSRIEQLELAAKNPADRRFQTEHGHQLTRLELFAKNASLQLGKLEGLAKNHGLQLQDLEGRIGRLESADCTINDLRKGLQGLQGRMGKVDGGEYPNKLEKVTTSNTWAHKRISVLEEKHKADSSPCKPSVASTDTDELKKSMARSMKEKLRTQLNEPLSRIRTELLLFTHGQRSAQYIGEEFILALGL